jgi:hypothetical protein
MLVKASEAEGKLGLTNEELVSSFLVLNKPVLTTE